MAHELSSVGVQFRTGPSPCALSVAPGPLSVSRVEGGGEREASSQRTANGKRQTGERWDSRVESSSLESFLTRFSALIPGNRDGRLLVGFLTLSTSFRACDYGTDISRSILQAVAER